MNRRFQVVAAVIGVAACTPSAGCSAVPRVVDQPTPPRAGAHDIVWQVSHGGGFTSLPLALSERPSITVYGDGRYLVPHVAEVAPRPPVVVTFDEGRLSDAELTRLEQDIAASHVFDDPEPDFGDPLVMDAGTTSVHGLGPDGTLVALDAYALGLGGTERLTGPQRDLRHRLESLVDDVDARLPDSGTTGYEATRLLVYAFDTFDSTGASAPHPWPGTLHTDLFDTRETSPACAVISGTSVGPVLRAAEHNPGNVWRDAAGTFSAVVTVALPGEDACPD